MEKAGLLDVFGITPGDDLQKDTKLQDNVAELFGGLLEIKAIVENKDYFPELWQSKGKKGLATESWRTLKEFLEQINKRNI